MKTYVPTSGDIESKRQWWLVDAKGLTLGRLSTVVADRLRGKHKPMWTPFIDCGDPVIVINADRVVLTGTKHRDKIYRRHTGYPGGLKEIAAGKLLRERPIRLIELAVTGMLPKSPLGRQMSRKLKVYAGGAHPHEAQQPKSLAIEGARRGE